MTRIKICGMTNVADALAAVEAGADALGFVFAESPRQVTAQSARQMIDALPPFVTTVGVFVDAPRAAVERTAAESGVTLVQLHGAESPKYCASLSRPLIKRIRPGDGSAATAAAMMKSCHVAAFLLDPGAGSGHSFGWSEVDGFRRALGAARQAAPPIVLAGGLTPANVGKAIQEARPYAVDVCSGVEARPGKKDVGKMHEFVLAVREADASYVTG